MEVEHKVRAYLSKANLSDGGITVKKKILLIIVGAAKT